MGKIGFKHIFLFFFLLHLLLFNINTAEWGDSYRILRASESIRELSYPKDEKRPPLLSIVLAARSGSVDQVMWGRFVMLLFSLGSFLVFNKILYYFFPNDSTKRKLALLLFALNPVYLYWSIRIMADIPFTFLVLFTFYLYLWGKSKSVNSYLWPISLGLLTGLSVLARFEGYILFGSIGLGLLFLGGFDGDLLVKIKTHFSKILIYAFSFIVTLLPYFYFRNPLTSSYFEEPGRRVYDLNTLAVYLLSLTFLFGFVFSCYFVFLNYKRMLVIVKSNPAMSAFVLVELFLVLVWPAAVPRLLVPTVPFLVILLTDSIITYFKSTAKSSYGRYSVLILLGLLGVYVAGQYYYKLQFLVLIKPLFVLVVLLSIFQLYFLYVRNLKLFLISLVLVLFVWSFTSIWIHKDIFGAVKEANEYAVENLEGRVGYNDVSSVSDWYLNVLSGNDNVEGFYFDLTKKENREYDVLKEKDLNYLLVTNEHNTDMTIDVTPWPHLVKITEFSQEVGGKTFFTKIFEFKR